MEECSYYHDDSQKVSLMRCHTHGGKKAIDCALDVRAENSRLLLQVRELQDIVRLCVEQGGLSFHVEGGKCPEDDTCDCPDALRVNAAMKGYTEKRVASGPKNERHDCDHCACSCSDCSNRCPHGIKVGDGPCGLCG